MKSNFIHLIATATVGPAENLNKRQNLPYRIHKYVQRFVSNANTNSICDVHYYVCLLEYCICLLIIVIKRNK